MFYSIYGVHRGPILFHSICGVHRNRFSLPSDDSVRDDRLQPSIHAAGHFPSNFPARFWCWKFTERPSCRPAEIISEYADTVPREDLNSLNMYPFLPLSFVLLPLSFILYPFLVFSSFTFFLFFLFTCFTLFPLYAY